MEAWARDYRYCWACSRDKQPECRINVGVPRPSIHCLLQCVTLCIVTLVPLVYAEVAGLSSSSHAESGLH